MISFIARTSEQYTRAGEESLVSLNFRQVGVAVMAMGFALLRIKQITGGSF
jgi:hypothetical protein